MILSDNGPSPKMGIFVMDVFRDGKLIEHFVGENLVVDASKAPLARLIGGTTTNNTITTIGFGTNGTSPVAGNTALTGSYTKLVDSVTYPSSNIAQFNWTLAAAEAAGLAIMEFGLLTGGGALFARKTRSTALNKASDLSLSGYWQIVF